jgi:ribosome-binding factor A
MRAVHDPGIGLVILTRVQVTADLQLARVYYRTLGTDSARAETARALARATPFLRRQVGGRLRLRRVPELRFIFDEAVDQEDRVEQLLREIEEARPRDDGTPHDDESPRDEDDDGTR